MKIAVISVTNQGDLIGEKLKHFYDIDLYLRDEIKKTGLKIITEKAFKSYNAVIFIASTGIAVRSIAPFLKSKTVDPAVLVIDSSGKFVISLVSGHLGGANELTIEIADILNAEPVITTATDNMGVIAPDVIARDNKLIIDDLKVCKEIAALLVEGKNILFLDDRELIGLPKGYTKAVNSEQLTVDRLQNTVTSEQLTVDILQQAGNSVKSTVKSSKLELRDEKISNQMSIDSRTQVSARESSKLNYDSIAGIVVVTNKEKYANIITSITEKSNVKINQLPILKLIRQDIVLGIGCRKDYSSELMNEKVLDKLKEYNLDKRAVKAIATVEVKKNERAIIELAEYLGCELKIFKLNEIKKVQSHYEGSDFVEKTIGVRAVCEPCVELLGASFISEKMKCDGMTLCIGESFLD